MMRRARAMWWAHQWRLAAEWYEHLLATVGQKRKPKPRPRPATQRRQRSPQTAMLPPVIAPSRAAISWLLGYSAFVATVITALRTAFQAFREPVEPRLRDYDDLVKSLNERRRAAGLPPAAENKWRDPTNEYLKPRPRRSQEPSPDPVPVDGEGAYELRPPSAGGDDGHGGGPRL